MRTSRDTPPPSTRRSLTKIQELWKQADGILADFNAGRISANEAIWRVNETRKELRRRIEYAVKPRVNNGSRTPASLPFPKKSNADQVRISGSSA
jgi:hypothetical protein